MAERGSWQAGWVGIADKFPATLARTPDPAKLADGQTPEAYGLGLDYPGLLYVESAPSDGTVWNEVAVASTPTNTPLTGTQTWRFAHNRLWGWKTGENRLYYGAYGYDSNYIIQGLGYVPCDLESTAITQVVPFGGNIAVFKADCLYLVDSAANPGDNFTASYVKQASGLPTAAAVVALDGVLYWANTHGVFAFNGQQVTELTAGLRGDLGAFSSAQVTSLRADFEKRRIVGRSDTGTIFIIEPGETAALYDYLTSGFRFTTRTLAGAESEPLVIDKVALVYRYTTSDEAAATLQVKINDTWKDAQTALIRPAQDNGRCEIPLTDALACRRWAMRITTMSAGLYVSRIMVHVKAGGVQGYSNK